MSKKIKLIIVIVLSALIIAVSVLIGLLKYTYESAITEANFNEAIDNSGETYRVSGFISKDRPVVYNPVVEPGLTSFYMEDKNGELMKVNLQGAMPQDLNQSDAIVLTGKVIDGVFYATEIFIKYPSNYRPQ